MNYFRILSSLFTLLLATALHAQLLVEHWAKGYNGPASSGDYATAVVVDHAGDVIVTGWSGTGVGRTDATIPDYLEFYTAKYSGATGALLWEQRYGEVGTIEVPGHAVVRGLAADSIGNVIVTGYAGTAGMAYYTAKYAASDGALLWQKRYSGPEQNDRAQALAVDGNDDIIVTGSSQTSPSAYDYYTAKYAKLDGALIWEMRYNGPANGSDLAKCVAVDGSINPRRK